MGSGTAFCFLETKPSANSLYAIVKGEPAKGFHTAPKLRAEQILNRLKIAPTVKNRVAKIIF